MTPKQREALETLERHGSQRRAAEALGISRSTLRHRVTCAQRYEESDPSVRDAMADTGMQDASILHSGWIKTDKASLYFQMPREDSAPEDIATRVKEALADVPPIPRVAAPSHADSDLLALYPLPDVHMGMFSWGKETGEDYDTNIARDRVMNGIGRCLTAVEPAGEAVLAVMGDFLHADDQTNQTPGSKHQLDVDSRHFRVMDTAISTLAASAEALLEKHTKVYIVVQPGNHDKTAYLAVLFALAERYRDNPRVEVQRKPGEFFVRQFGRCLIASHHGDKSKAERLVMFLADQWAEMWGQTRFRYLFTGHLHHHKSQDIGGCLWEQLRAVTARDAYAVSHAYAARAEMQAITFHRDLGEVGRVRIAF